MTKTAEVAEVARTVESPASRLAWGDYVRVFGTVAVIAQHVAHRTTLFGTPDLASTTWWGVMSIEAACRWAVPVFVMLSGALLLNPERRETPHEFYRKRFWRIGIPLVFWSAFYTLPSLVANGFTNAAMAEAGSKLAHGRPAYHMYFLFVIAGLYLFTPYLRIIVRDLSKTALRQLWLALLAVAWGGAALDIVYGYQHTVFTEFVPYLAYYFAGYDLRTVRLSSRATWTATAVIALALAAMVLVTAPLTARFGITERARYLYDYFSPTVTVVSVCFFLFAVTVFDRWRSGVFAIWAARIAPATLGIFLMHPALYIAVQHAQERGLVPVWEWTVASTLLATFIAFVACWVATAVVQRIPILRTVVG